MVRRLVVASMWLACACGGSGKTASSTPAEPPIENKAPPAAEPAAAPAPAPDSQEGALMQMAAFTAKMCSCTDSACAEQVSDELTRWARDMAKSSSEPMTMTEEQQQRAVEIGTRMGECMQRAMTTGSVQPAQP